MKSNIKIGGLVTVGDMRFHNIEGGFGSDKRSMLVKDIAAIHDKDLKHVNELINRNRKRFVDEEDIVDLKTGRFERLVSELISQGIFTKAEVGNANNLYILSERGYAKLLKLLEDDLAWEKYGELLDGYFHMRKEIKEGMKATPRLGEVNATVRIVSRTLKDAKVPAPFIAENVKNIYSLVGINIVTTGAEETEKFYDPTEIADLVGVLSSNHQPHDQAISAIIKKLPVEPTEMRSVPFQNPVSGHSDTHFQYAPSVVDRVRQWLLAENYPDTIHGAKKNYHVIYRTAADLPVAQ